MASPSRQEVAAGGGNPFDPVPTRITLSPKYTCIIKPAQSGKTRTMQEMMLEYERLAHEFHPDEAGLVNIVICSKNLNLVKQLEARMSEIIAPAAPAEEDDEPDNGTADATINGTIFSWMTGTKDTNITADDLGMKIITGRVRMVVCCAHPKRLQYVGDLLKIFHDSPFLSRRFNIWMDEADDYTNIWSDVDLAKYNSVSSIYLVSATIDDIVEKHTYVKVKPLGNTFPPCYRKIADAVIEHVDLPTRDATEYFKQVYALHKDTLCVPGTRLFAPGSDLVASHNAIAEFLQLEGYAVAVINGRRKHILVPGMAQPLDILKEVQPGEPMELGKIIARLYDDHDLVRFPFAITGKLCLGRGITFQYEVTHMEYSIDDDGDITTTEVFDYDFLFDVGIIPPMNNSATLYQCAARMFGNTGGFRNYKPSTTYTTTANHTLMVKSENIAKNLAVLVHDYNLADVGRDEMDWADHGDEEQYRLAVAARGARRLAVVHESISHLEECDSMDSVRALWARILAEEDATSDSNPRQPHQRDGAYICSLGGKSDKQKATTVRTKFGGTSTANWGSGITDAAVGKYICRVYVGYEDDGRAVFFLRWTKKA